MADFTQTNSMRSITDSLQNSAGLLANVEARLAAARRAGGLPDLGENPLPPSTLDSRAGDLGALLVGMKHAVAALKSANHGVLAIQALVGGLAELAEAAAGGARPLDQAAAIYDAELARLDQIAAATCYGSTRLIDGSDPEALTVLFNGTSASTTPRTLPELALTAAGLGLTPAATGWTGPEGAAASRQELARAATTLAEAAASLTQALGTVQIRQDFTSQLIATLRTVTDPDPAATERPRPALQSLAPAAQANQAVLRLFT